MPFFEFQNAFSSLPIIEASEIEMRFPNFNTNALTRWQRKGYLYKIRNGYYRLSSNLIHGEKDLFFMANRIYQPSYISLESGLRYYDFIPEGVFTITSVSSKKTQLFTTSQGNFSYQQLKKSLFFGYQLKEIGNFRYKMASAEKALLDFLYLHPHLRAEEDFFELRLNISNENQLRKHLLAVCQNFDFKQLAKDVHPFLFQPTDVRRVLLFNDYFKAVEL